MMCDTQGWFSVPKLHWPKILASGDGLLLFFAFVVIFKHEDL